MGNVSMDQRVVSPSTSNPWVSRSQDERGNWWTADGTGRSAVSLLRNEGITSHQVSAKVSQSDVEAASKTASAAAGEVVTAGTTRAASLNEALSRVRQRSSSSRASAGQTMAGFEEVSRAAESLSSEAKRVARETGYDESQVADTMLRFSAMPSAFGVGGGAAVQKRYGVSLSDAEKKILDHTNTDTFKAARNFGDRVSRDKSFLNSLASEGQSGLSLSSSLVQTANRAETAERRFTEAVSRSEETRRAFEKGETISRDLALDPAYVNEVMNYERAASQYGANTQSLAAYFSSRLGNYSLNPTPRSDSSAVPLTFNGVREAHRRQAFDPAFNADIDRIKAANDSDVGIRPIASPPVPPQADSPGFPAIPASSAMRAGAPVQLRDPTGFRADIEGQGAAQTQGTHASYQNYDARHEVERKPDGGITTRRSLVGTSARNLKRDGEAAYANAGDASDAALREMAAARERAAESPRQKAIDATPEVPTMTPKAGRRPRDQ